MMSVSVVLELSYVQSGVLTRGHSLEAIFIDFHCDSLYEFITKKVSRHGDSPQLCGLWIEDAIFAERLRELQESIVKFFCIIFIILEKVRQSLNQPTGHRGRSSTHRKLCDENHQFDSLLARLARCQLYSRP